MILNTASTLNQYYSKCVNACECWSLRFWGGGELGKGGGQIGGWVADKLRMGGNGLSEGGGFGTGGGLLGARWPTRWPTGCGCGGGDDDGSGAMRQ